MEIRQRGFVHEIVIILSLLGLTIISVIAILREADGRDGKYVAIAVLTGVFPLIAALIGGMLAYHASLSNFAMAANTLRNLTSPVARSSDIPVTSAMIETSKIVGMITLAHHQPAASISLQDVLSNFKSGVTRIPVVDAKGTIMFVIHESTVTKFIAKIALDQSPKLTPAKATLKDLLHDPELGQLPKAFVIVPGSFTLADTKKKIDWALPCRDAFVTQTGRPDDPIIGWVPE
jgi:hypothetical protein